MNKINGAEDRCWQKSARPIMSESDPKNVAFLFFNRTQYRYKYLGTYVRDYFFFYYLHTYFLVDELDDELDPIYIGTFILMLLKIDVGSSFLFNIARVSIVSIYLRACNEIDRLSASEFLSLDCGLPTLSNNRAGSLSMAFFSKLKCRKPKNWNAKRKLNHSNALQKVLKICNSFDC